MALPTSGQITLQQIHDEAGGTTNSTAQCSVDDADIRALINRSAGGVQSFDDYYGAASSNILTCLRIGGGSTTTNQFPNANATLSTGNKIVVVVVLLRVQSGSGISNGPTSVTVGGQSATLRTISNANVSSLSYGHINSIWTLETTLSGSQLVTGSTTTTTGNNSCHIYEVTGHTSATPHSVAPTSNYTGSASTTDVIALSQVSGGSAIFGITATSSGNTGTLSSSPSTTVLNHSFSNLNHAGANKDNTTAGTTAYTWTNTQSGYFNIVAASFK